MGHTIRAALWSGLLGGALVSAFVAVGCASTAPIVEQDAGFDFAAVKTYAWVTDEPVLITFGEDQPSIRTKDNELLVRAAVERELSARGMEKVDAASADALIAFSVGVRMRYRIEGGDRTSFADGPGTKQTKGTLNIYVLNHETDEEVWHGSVSEWLKKSDDAEVVVNEAVAKIMSRYP